MSFILYCLGIYFWFYLFNYSDIAESIRSKVFNVMHPYITYALQCSYCYTFWITLVAFCLSLVPLSYIFAAPVVNLFLFKILNNLSA
jgi:hypothetical protein